ncbi:DUF5117 domain-containing protein [bacterium]|nr:DUF5117 domain-containing protein [bacterium]
MNLVERLCFGLLILAVTMSSAIAQENKPEFKPIADVVKGAQKYEGFYNLHKKDSNLFMEIPSSKMNREFMLSFSVARGIAQGYVVAGMTLTESIYYWKLADKKVFLVEKNVRHTADSGDPINLAVKEGFGDSVIASFAIRAKTGGTYLIDLGSFLFSDYLELGRQLGGYRLDRSRSTWGIIKGFPRNMEIEVDATYSGGGRGDMRTVPDSRYLPVTLHYSLSHVPKSTGFRPRKADDRIGFFLTAKKDYSKESGSQEPFVRYINRWNLQKADPSAEVSPPKKPIRFYIDKSVPYKYRPMVRAGLEEWNKAFEKAGFRDAIEVRQMDEDADWDPEDINYNTVRWMTGEAGYAIGPSRTNPLTGEIYDADILVDSGWLNYFEWQYETLVDEYRALQSEYKNKQEGPISLNEFLQHLDQKDKPIFEDQDHPHMYRCEYAKGLRQQMAIAAAAAMVNGGTDEEEEKDGLEEFIRQGMKNLIMHEFGHTLGLRHNFKSSAMIPLEDLHDKEKAEKQGLLGSVMDYDLANVAPPGTEQGYYFTPTIGAWDYLAIEYGYKEAGAKQLEKIAATASKAEYKYGTDGDAARAIDPLCNTRDMSNDLIGFAKQRTEVITHVWDQLVEKIAEEGKGYQKVRSAFYYTLFDLQRNHYHACRYIGGFYIHRDHKGDPEESYPLDHVSAPKQREALKFVCETALSDEIYQLDPELVARLAPNRWDHWGSNTPSSLDVPLHDRILVGQLQIISRIFSSGVLQRIHNGRMYVKSGGEIFTIDEIYTNVTDAVWSELEKDIKGNYSSKKPFISSLRRDLQRTYLQYILMAHTLNPSYALPQDARSIAWNTLKSLKTKLDDTLEKIEEENGESEVDALSLAHLRETQARIDKALDAAFSIFN